jgi:hypothetical protein
VSDPPYRPPRHLSTRNPRSGRSTDPSRGRVGPRRGQPVEKSALTARTGADTDSDARYCARFRCELMPFPASNGLGSDRQGDFQ